MLLLVGDSLRADSFKRYVPKASEYKELVPAYSQTPGATFSLLFGRHLTHVFWPTELNPMTVLRFAGIETLKDTSATFGIFNFIPTLSKLLAEESVVHALRKAGVRTMVYSQLDSPPLSLPPFDVEDLANTTRLRLDYVSRAILAVSWRLATVATKRYRNLGKMALLNTIIDVLPWKKGIIFEAGNFPARHLYEDMAEVAIYKLKKLKGDWFVYFHAFTPHGEYSCGEFRHALDLHMLTWSFNVHVGELLKLYQVDSLERLLRYYRTCDVIRDVLEDEGIFRKLRTAYEECVKLFASFVKRLEEELVPEGWTVIVTSDHPEYFGEDCLSGHPPLVPLRRPPERVPLLLLGEGSLEGVRAYTQIPELVAEHFSVRWAAPSSDEVLVTIPYLRDNKWSIMVVSTDGDKTAYHAVDESGNEVWGGPEELREAISQHERRAAEERKKIINRLKIKLKLRRRLLNK